MDAHFSEKGVKNNHKAIGHGENIEGTDNLLDNKIASSVETASN
jgi:hypothetical protein